LSGQQKLYVEQVTRWEFLGHFVDAGVAVRAAAAPTTTASTMATFRIFLRMLQSPRESRVTVAFGAPDLDERHADGR
jgi:hypothetical protein